MRDRVHHQGSAAAKILTPARNLVSATLRRDSDTRPTSRWVGVSETGRIRIVLRQGVTALFPDRAQVWWIVPAGQRLRHAVTERPGAHPAGDVVEALCAAAVKIPYETWPASKEPLSRHITDRCVQCAAEVAEQQRGGDLIVNVWDS